MLLKHKSEKNDAYLAEIKNKTHKHVPINYLGDKS